MATRASALYSPSRRGLPMTFAYTQPLPRLFAAPATTRLSQGDRLAASRLRPVVLAARAIAAFFRG